MHLLAVKAVAAVCPLIFSSAFLPSRDLQQASVSVPAAISQFLPLPQELLLTSYSRGQSELVSGRFLEAVENFNIAAIAAEATGSSPNVYSSRGIAEEKLYRWEEAIKDYELAQKLIKQRFPFQEDATVLSNLANAESGRGDYELALRDFSRSMKLDKGFAAPKIGKGLVLWQLDRRDEAKQIFNELVQKYPSYSDGLAAFAVMNYEDAGGYTINVSS